MACRENSQQQPLGFPQPLQQARSLSEMDSIWLGGGTGIWKVREHSSWESRSDLHLLCTLQCKAQLLQPIFLKNILRVAVEKPAELGFAEAIICNVYSASIF